MESFLNEPLNILSDSAQAVFVCRNTETAYIKPSLLPAVFMFFDSLQHLLRQRSRAVYTGPICSHLVLPGPLVVRNHQADAMVIILLLEKARLSHSFFHQNWRSLSKEFSISQTLARQVIAQCSDCQGTGTSPPPSRVNPGGLTPNEIWQMDGTHIPSFGQLCYVHVIIDTFSNYILISALARETTKHIIKLIYHTHFPF